MMAKNFIYLTIDLSRDFDESGLQPGQSLELGFRTPGEVVDGPKVKGGELPMIFYVCVGLCIRAWLPVCVFNFR